MALRLNGLEVIFQTGASLFSSMVLAPNRIMQGATGLHLRSYLVFNIIILMICCVSKVLDLILFADDINIFYSHKESNSLTQIISED